jgi:hypothetical protein
MTDPLPQVGNPRAIASAALGLLAVAAIPVGVALSYYLDQVTLLSQAAVAGPAGFLLGWIAIVEARRGREQLQRTLGRSGGAGWATAGRFLGTLAVCAAITVGLAIGFYGLLRLFAD